jgi:hypothetical protein
MFRSFPKNLSILCLALIAAIVTPVTGWTTEGKPGNHFEASGNEKPIYLAQSIICQRQIGPYTLLRRVSFPNGGCFDQIVDTRSGQILQSNPAPCNPNC